ncbi:uncharacterized protein isoform X1 [Takifugu rubripes]|uniref:uncharacterized protein isoform X1 n=1 Tax=Takifugu rubripes TaxID=31033 RepID=UPI001145517B|nr:uncharacterized protein LOC115250692 isoform X1 [Takifugu rubripes]
MLFLSQQANKLQHNHIFKDHQSRAAEHQSCFENKQQPKRIEAAGETLKNLHNNAQNIVKALLHDLGVPDEEVEGVSDEIEDVEKDLEEEAEEEESVAESTGETEEEVEEEADVSVAGANEAVEDATHEEDE